MATGKASITMGSDQRERGSSVYLIDPLDIQKKKFRGQLNWKPHQIWGLPGKRGPWLRDEVRRVLRHRCPHPQMGWNSNLSPNLLLWENL